MPLAPGINQKNFESEQQSLTEQSLKDLQALGQVFFSKLGSNRRGELLLFKGSDLAAAL